MNHEITARAIVLDAAQQAPRSGVQIWQLVKIGALFGFADNAIRVAVTRLCAGGLLESNGAGCYLLTPADRKLRKHGGQWRRGEDRVRPWKGGFLAITLPARTNTNRAVRHGSEVALDRLCFREGIAPRLYLRPDNLRQTRSVTEAQLADFGLQDDAEVFVMGGFSERMMGGALLELWPTKELAREYQRHSRALTRTLERAPEMALEDALLELTLVGGAALRTLGHDPLLPEEMVPSAGRRELTELGLRYLALAAKLWNRYLELPRLELIEGAHDGR